MALHHHELELRLRDAELLRLYVQSGMAKREMQSASLKKAELGCRRLELEAKESAERATRAEAERDEACHEAVMAKLATEGAVNTRAQIESELARVQRALALTENARQRAESEHGADREALALAGEACRKAEEENDCLTDERLALILEPRTIKDEFVAFREKAVADREMMEAEFDSSGDTLFNYGYGCCIFTHNIYGSKPQIPDGMPDPSVPLTLEFFANPRCPPSVSSIAPTLDLVVVSRKDRSESIPTASREEAILSIGPPALSDGGVDNVIAN